MAIPVEFFAPPPQVRGAPLFGNAFQFARDPARFFVKCYRDYGPIFRVSILGNSYVCIAGAEAALFMGTREGRECLRSREVWQPLVSEFGASKMISAEDGELHRALRAIMKRGFSREAIKGRYAKMLGITANSLQRDWRPGSRVSVVQAMQYLVVDQLGIILTGAAPREYVKDIRTTILHILNATLRATNQMPVGVAGVVSHFKSDVAADLAKSRA